jgi:hypothetical protein
MTCSEVSEHIRGLSAYEEAVPPKVVRDHLEQCSTCRGLWDFLTRRDAGEPVSTNVQSRIQSAILASLKPVSPLPCTARLAAGFLIIFTILSAVFIMISGMRGVADMGVLPFAAVLGIVGAVVLVLAIALSREMVPGSPRFLTPPALFLSLLAALFLVVGFVFPWEVTRDLLPGIWHCFRAGLAFSFPAAVFVVLILRRGAVLSLPVAGAGAGLLAGLVGVTVLHFACDMRTAPHIAVAHLGIALAGALGGYLLGRYIPAVWPRMQVEQRSH